MPNRKLSHVKQTVEGWKLKTIIKILGHVTMLRLLYSTLRYLIYALLRISDRQFCFSTATAEKNLFYIFRPPDIKGTLYSETTFPRELKLQKLCEKLLKIQNIFF